MSDQNRKRVSVDIFGHPYTIIGEENADHIRYVASVVDRKMREISKANPLLDTSKLAILTAINIANDYTLLKDEYELLKRDYELVIKRLEQKEEKASND